MESHTRRAVHATPVSIVIPTLNAQRSLPRLLGSLSASTTPLDVVVVDGGSDDATGDVVEGFRRTAPPHVSLRMLSSPVRNPSAQCNQGAAAARHETLLFLGSGVLIAPADLAVLTERFRRERLVVASCRLRPAGRDPRREATYALRYVWHKLMERWRPRPMGAFILTTREVFQYSGGFDPRLPRDGGAHFCRKAACLGRFRMLPVTIRVSA